MVKCCWEQKWGTETSLFIRWLRVSKARGQWTGKYWFTTYQISVNEAVLLQVLHPFTHVLTHAQQHVSTKMALSLSEKIQKAAPFHELSHNVNRLLLGTDTIKLNQLGVCQFPGGEVTRTQLGRRNQQELMLLRGRFLMQKKGGTGKNIVTYIITLASSIKSSSHIAPSRIALIATLYWARHLPSLTTPNSPLPNSLIKVSSEGLISHFSVRRKGTVIKFNREQSSGQ